MYMCRVIIKVPYYGILIVQAGILLGMGITPFVVHADEDLQFSVCGNTTTPPSASLGEVKEWSDFVFSRLFYFNTGVAALSFFAFLITVFSKESTN